MGCSSPTTKQIILPAYTPSGQPPATPTNVRQTGSTQSSVTVSWGSVSGATSYSYEDQLGYTNTISGTSTTLSGMSPGQTIWFKVRANNSYGSSSFSGYVYLTASAASCQPGYYWNGSQCRPNQATQNISAFDCTANASGLYAGCFAACWGSVPAGTDEIQIWHVNPNTGTGVDRLATVSPGTTFKTICGLSPGDYLHWNVRALVDGHMIGYSNVVKSTCLASLSQVAQDQCELQGGTWANGVCISKEEMDCRKTGGAFRDGRCVSAAEISCINNHGIWANGICKPAIQAFDCTGSTDGLTPGQFAVCWGALPASAKKVNLYYKAGGVMHDYLGIKTSFPTPIVVTGLPPGTPVTWHIKTVNDWGKETAYSNEVLTVTKS